MCSHEDVCEWTAASSDMMSKNKCFTLRRRTYLQVLTKKHEEVKYREWADFSHQITCESDAAFRRYREVSFLVDDKQDVRGVDVRVRTDEHLAFDVQNLTHGVEIGGSGQDDVNYTLWSTRSTVRSVQQHVSTKTEKLERTETLFATVFVNRICEDSENRQNAFRNEKSRTDFLSVCSGRWNAESQTPFNRGQPEWVILSLDTVRQTRVILRTPP